MPKVNAALLKKRGKTKLLGRVMNILLPSIKMKSYSARGVLFERELHCFLLTHFTGYTVTSGNITGYWKDQSGCEECNEHREYQVAIDHPNPRLRVKKMKNRRCVGFWSEKSSCERSISTLNSGFKL
jgi:hypothetical protein